jgi:hypothetical protein
MANRACISGHILISPCRNGRMKALPAAHVTALLTVCAHAAAEPPSRGRAALELVRQEPAPSKAPAKLPKPSADQFAPKALDEAEAIIVLPGYTVNEKPLDPIELKLRKLAPVFAELQRQYLQELEATEPTLLDSFLNPPNFTFFGSMTAEARAAQARARIEELSFERMLVIALSQAKSPEEKSDIQEILASLRTARRRAK